MEKLEMVRFWMDVYLSVVAQSNWGIAKDAADSAVGALMTTFDITEDAPVRAGK